MAGISTILSTFKTKIEDAVALVPSMTAEEKLKSVQFWNVVSERLQEIVNSSAADISALAFDQQPPKPSDAGLLSAAEHPETDPHEDILQPNASTVPGLAVQHPVPPPPPAPSLPEHHSISRQPLDPLPNTTYRHDDQLHSTTTKTEVLTPSAEDPSTNLIDCHQKQLPSSGRMQEQPVLPDSSAAPVPRSASSELRGLLTAEGLSGATKVAKKEVDQKQTSGRMKKAKSSGKRSKKSLDFTKNIEVLNKKVKLEPKIRRQPPRTKRRKKNFALTAADSDDSGGIIATPESATATPANHLDENKLPKVVDGQEVDDDEENGTSGIILTNAKSLRGTAEAENCFDQRDLLDEDGDPGEGIDDEDEEEEEEEEEGEAAIPEHSPTVNEQGHYVCFYCKKVFETLSAYGSHKYVHTKPYACNECLSRFSTKGNLIVHLRRHTGEKPFTCYECHAKFSTKGNLKRHVKTHSGERPWECPQCGGRFTEKKSLKVHMRRHTGEKPYKCSICGKNFAQTGILQTHMAMHNDEKEHLCEHCGKSFRQKSQLRLHMMRHEGVRKYQCPQCPSRFLTKGDLERHNRIHTGERPFVCELCGKTFTRQQSLNEHTNRHYGLKPYQCKYCMKGFAEMSACYKHIKQHERLPGSAGIPSDDLSPPSPDDQDGCGEVGLPHEDPNHPMSITCDSPKYAVLVQTDDQRALDVGSEISVMQHDHHQMAPVIGGEDDGTEPELTVVPNDFTAINLLANASSFQHTF